MEAQSWVSEVADAVKREVNQVPGTLKRMAAGGIRVHFYVIYRTLRATVNNDNPPEEEHVVAQKVITTLLLICSTRFI